MRVLRERGVTDVFTLSGNHVMSVFDAALDAGIALVHARHEAATVHMADARARVSGDVGIALVTGGPGHANAVSALYTAQMAEAPLVLLSGHAPRNQRGMGAFQEMAQDDVAKPLAKAAWTCERPDDVARDVARAIDIARAGRPGPVSLGLPSDVLESRVADGVQRAVAAQPSAITDRPQSLDAEARAIVDRLKRATRPIVLVGPASMTRHGRVPASALENALAIPVVGMESPRGIADPSLGAFAEMLAKADCVLLVGKRPDFTLQFGKSPPFSPDCIFLQIDADERELQRARRTLRERLEFACTAPACAALQVLAKQAQQAGRTARSGWRDEVEAAIAYRPAQWDHPASSDGRLHPLEALRPLQALLDAHPQSVFVSDGGEFGQWAQACLHAPHRVINGMAGAIGSALPYAIGARCALRDVPIVATLGDGTFGFHAAEIDTAARYGHAFVAVIGNDARWNAEYQIQLREYGRERLVACELAQTRYDEVCMAFGGHGEFVTGAAEMPGALARAHASRRPACINVAIDGVAAPRIARPAG